MKLYGKGLWRFIPGDGTTIGNYAFIYDVVKGHMLAAQYGKGGERYIFDGENMSFLRFFDELARAYGSILPLSPSAFRLSPLKFLTFGRKSIRSCIS